MCEVSGLGLQDCGVYKDGICIARIHVAIEETTCLRRRIDLRYFGHFVKHQREIFKPGESVIVPLIGTRTSNTYLQTTPVSSDHHLYAVK